MMYSWWNVSCVTTMSVSNSTSRTIAVEVVKSRNRPRQQRVDVIHVHLRRIAQRHEFAGLAELGGDRRSKHPHRPAGSPDNRKAFLRHLSVLQGDFLAD